MVKPTREEIKSAVFGILQSMHNVDGISSGKIYQRFKKEANGRFSSVEETDINRALHSLAESNKFVRVESVLKVYFGN